MRDKETELSGLKSDFEQWRMLRKHRRDRIPDELWAKARAAGEEFGYAKISKLLGLDYYQLKDKQKKKKEAEVAKVTKLDFFSPASEQIEIVRPSGFRLAIPANSALAEKLLAKFLEGI